MTSLVSFVHRLTFLFVACCFGLISFSAEAAIKRYRFDVQVQNISRLCHAKPTVTINGKFPGLYKKEIEFLSMLRTMLNITCQFTGKNEKEPYETRVKIDKLLPLLGHISVSFYIFYRHELKQYRNRWAEGPACIAQCPTRRGGSYTYDFNVTGQRGTLWWHADILWLRGTVYGVVEKMYLKLQRLDNCKKMKTMMELIPLVQDSEEWWNNDVEAVVNQGSRIDVPPNMYDAHTINGKPGSLFPRSDKRKRYYLEKGFKNLTANLSEQSNDNDMVFLCVRFQILLPWRLKLERLIS